MVNHIVIISSIVISFFAFGLRNPTRYLLFWGILTLPFSYDYTVYELVFEGFTGWTQGIVIRLSDIFLALLYVFLKFKRKHSPEGKPKMEFRFPILIVFSAFVISLYSAIWRIYSFCEILDYVKIVSLYYFVPVKFLQNDDDLSFIINSIFCALFFQAFLGVVQFMTQDYYMLFRTGQEAALTVFYGYVRSHGTVGQPNGYAGYILPSILLLVSCVLSDTGKNPMRLKILFVFGLLALIFSFSRAAWVVFFIGTSMIFFLHAKRDFSKSRKSMAKYITFIIVVGVLIALTFKNVSERFTLPDQGAAEDRWHLMKIAFNIIKDNYLTGIGVNNYRFAMYKFVPADYDWNFIYIVHNVFLLILAETGILGLVGILYMFYLPCRKMFHVVKEGNAYHAYAVGLFTMFVCTTMQNLVDLTWSSPICNSSFFLQLGIANYMVSRSGNGKTQIS